MNRAVALSRIRDWSAVSQNLSRALTAWLHRLAEEGVANRHFYWPGMSLYAIVGDTLKIDGVEVPGLKFRETDFEDPVLEGWELVMDVVMNDWAREAGLGCVVIDYARHPEIAKWLDADPRFRSVRTWGPQGWIADIRRG